MHALANEASTPTSAQSPLSPTCLVESGVPERISETNAENVFSTTTSSDGFDPLMKYSVCVSKAPCCFTCIYLLLFAIVIAVMWKDVDIETDFGVFIRADGEAVRHQDAFNLALSKQKGVRGRRLAKPALPSIRRLEDTDQPAFTHFVRRDLSIVYKARSGNALDEQVLREVRDFEKSLRSLPKWQELCVDRIFNWRWTWACQPGESLSPFAWPTLTPPNRTAHGDNYLFDIHFDGDGTNLLPFTVMLKHMQHEFKASEESRDIKRYFPTGWDVERFLNGTGPPPSAIKSRFTFFIGYALPGWSRSETRKEFAKIDEELKKFFQNDVYGKINDWLDADEEEVGERHADVYYTSVYIDEHEMMLTLHGDLLFSAGSIAFVTFWMWFQMRSVFLSAACFFVVFGSVPLAFVLTPAERTTLATLAPIFLITIIDIDVIFVFVNFWIQSKGTLVELHERVAWTISNAGKSCLATSLTTSVSFFANLVSAVQPLREFGLLMGLCVMCVYLLALLVLPPLMMLEYRFTEWREERQRARLYSAGGTQSEPSESQEQFSIVPAMPTVIDVSDGPSVSNPSQPSKLPKITSGQMYSGQPLPAHDLSDIRDVSAQSESGLSGNPQDAPSETLTPSPSIGSNKKLLMPDSDNGSQAASPLRKLDSKRSNSARKRTSMFFVNPRKARSCSYKCLFALVEFISSCAWLVLLCTGLTVPFLVVGILSNIELDMDKPKLFPKEHNQNMAIKYMEDFSKASDIKPREAPLAKGAACNATRFNHHDLHDDDHCVFQWCDADPYDLTGWNRSTVKCHRSVTMVHSNSQWTSLGFETKTCNNIRLSNRFAAGGFKLPDAEFNKAWSRLVDEAVGYDVPAESKERRIGSNIGILAVESWEEGTVRAEAFRAANVEVKLETTSSATESCYIDTFCVVNMPGCQLKMPHWKSHPAFVLDASSRRLAIDGDTEWPLSRGTGNTSGAPERRLVTGTEVRIVWGITAPLTTPLVGMPEWKWRFDPSFELSNPWAQRAVYEVCRDAWNARELFIKQKKCWIENFKAWLSDRREERFPSRTFDKDVVDWFNEAASWTDKKQLWFEQGKVVACQIQLYPSISQSMSSSGVLKNKRTWDDWLSSMNLKASLTADNAWHVSQRWVHAEANEVIMNSTILTIVIELLLGGVCILIFTGDPLLALIVLGLVVINIAGLAFIMVTIFKWLIGPIEVICLVVFVGYSVTFGLHISGDYARVQEDDRDLLVNNRVAKEMQRIGLRRFWRAFNANIKVTNSWNHEDLKGPCEQLTPREQRLERTRMAMLHVGGAIISAAFSSAGTSIFLMMCTLTIFNKIGAVVMTITLLSVVVTLVSLPAALIVCGPNFHPCYKRCWKRGQKKAVVRS